MAKTKGGRSVKPGVSKHDPGRENSDAFFLGGRGKKLSFFSGSPKKTSGISFQLPNGPTPHSSFPLGRG